jgi:hypothetical protein
MKPHTDSNRRPARLVYGAVFVLLTLLISVVLIKHFDGQADQGMTASAGPVASGDPAKDLTNSGVPRGPAASASSVGSATSAASAASEPPNPFKAFLENGKTAAPVAKAAAPVAASGAKASAVADPFKAFLDSGQASAAQASAAQAPAPDAQAPSADPFKEALERQQQQQPPR